MALVNAVLKRWPLYAFLASGIILAVAHAFETFGHLPPCHLCLKQREAYWAALAVSAIAITVSLVRPAAPAPRIASLLLAVVFGYGAYLAVFHAGAEWKWWPAPASCSSVGAVSGSDIKAFLGGHAAKGPACDQAPWRLAGLSMAGWNALAAGALTLVSLWAGVRKPPAS